MPAAAPRYVGPQMAVAAYFSSQPWATQLSMWDQVAAAGAAVRLVVADQSYSTLGTPGAVSDITAKFRACRQADQLVFGYVYGAGGQIQAGPPGSTFTEPQPPHRTFPCVGDQIDTWHQVYGSEIDGIYVDVGPTDCNNGGQSPAPANYQGYVSHIHQYPTYQVFLLAPLYPDDQPVTTPWLRNLGAEYLGLWEAGTVPYQRGGYHAVDYCDPNWPQTFPSLGIPAWWDPGPALRYGRVHIINDCQDAATMQSIAQLAIGRGGWTIWITLARHDPVLGSVYDQLPPYWDDEVRFFWDQVQQTEQPMPYRRTQQVGGTGGGPFADDLTEVRRLAGMTIRHGVFVDAIQCTWEMVDGSTRVGTQYGGNGGQLDTIAFAAGEYVVGLSGRSGALVDQLLIRTNRATYGPYGGNGGGPFNLAALQGTGFFGRSGLFLDAVGAFAPA